MAVVTSQSELNFWLKDSLKWSLTCSEWCIVGPAVGYSVLEETRLPRLSSPSLPLWGASNNQSRVPLHRDYHKLSVLARPGSLLLSFIDSPIFTLSMYQEFLWQSLSFEIQIAQLLEPCLGIKVYDTFRLTDFKFYAS